jgi:hypothetical protein
VLKVLRAATGKREHTMKGEVSLRFPAPATLSPLTSHSSVPGFAHEPIVRPCQKCLSPGVEP